jgi:hypothetical protein
MYDFLFDGKILTAMLALALTPAACALTGTLRYWWRTLLFNFTPAIACAFFVSALWSPAVPHRADLLAGFLFEFTVLCLHCGLVAALFSGVHRMALPAVGRGLRLTLMLQLLVAWPLLASEGFGVFSEGSRIDYLFEGSAAKYLTYLGVLLATVQAGLVARAISIRGRFGLTGLLVAALNLALSLTSGSKGGFFLWLLSVLALIDYRQARISRSRIAAFALFLAAALTVTTEVVSTFIGITWQEFSELAFDRFFLTNDARALAFDLRSSASAGAGLFVESFRSLAALFGVGPVHPPIGVLLYDLQFATAGNVGANGSLAALIMFYSLAGYALVPSIGACVLALLLVAAVYVVRATMRRPETSYAVLALGASCLTQLSQDFLAFQVVLPLTALAVVVFWFYERTHVSAGLRISAQRGGAGARAGL